MVTIDTKFCKMYSNKLYDWLQVIRSINVRNMHLIKTLVRKIEVEYHSRKHCLSKTGVQIEKM